MRVLWVCNIMLPEIARKIGREDVSCIGGWMTGMWRAIRRMPELSLGICFPVYGTSEAMQGVCEGSAYYGFWQKEMVCHSYDREVERQLRKIMEHFQPDMVHIFGTEYMHALAAVKAFGKRERTVISIQGMVSVYAEHFMAGVPYWVQRGCTFRDIVKRDNLLHQQKSFYRRAVFEREAIACSGHVIGRTDWDRACTMQINPAVFYHFCNETLRDSFYKPDWNIEECEPYSLFVSQGSYPIKGFHQVLKAAPILLKRYPKLKIYVAGGNIMKQDSLGDRLRMTSYGKYIRQLTEGYGLEDRVFYTGFLEEEAMKERYRKAHVFVSPSSIENSPNSVGEAMLLGMPVVASDVGGVRNMLEHGKEGYVYPADAYYMMAYYIGELFENPERAVQMGRQAALRAAHTHHREKNRDRLLEIYEEIVHETGDYHVSK